MMRATLRAISQNARFAAEQNEMPKMAIWMYAVWFRNFIHFSTQYMQHWMIASTSIASLLPDSLALRCR